MIQLLRPHPILLACLTCFLVFGSAHPGSAQDISGADIQGWIRKLSDPDPATQKAAAQSLIRGGAAVVPALIEALDSAREATLKVRIVRILGERKTREVLPRLRSFLASPKTPEALRGEAARVLGTMADTASKPLLVYYLEENLAVAAEALGNLGDDEALPELLQQLSRSMDAHTQVSLAVALCKLGARAGVDLLLSMAFRPSGDAVIQAIQGLNLCVDRNLPVPEVVVPDRSAVYQLQLRWNRECVSLPLQVGPGSPSPGLRARIKALVACCGSHKTKKERKDHQVLMVALRTPAAEACIQAFSENPSPEASEEIVRILVEMAPYAVRPLIRELRSDRPAGRAGAVRALRDMPVQGRKFPCLNKMLAEVEPAALSALKRARGIPRTEVIDLIGWVGAGPSREPLTAVLLQKEKETPEARLAAARSLGLIGVEQGKDALWKVVTDCTEPLILRCEAAFSSVLLGEVRGTGKLVSFLAEGDVPIEYLRRLSGWTYFGHEMDPAGAVVRWQTWWKKYAAVIRVNPYQVKMELLWKRENRVFHRDIMEGWLARMGSRVRWIDRVDQEARTLPVSIRMIPALEEVIRTSEDIWIRFHAVQMLSIRGERAAVPALIHALKDPVALIRSTAAEGLGLIGRDFGYEDYSAGLKVGLIPLLKDSDPYVRIEAAYALALLGYPDGIPALIEGLSGANAAVIDFAWIMLRKVTGGRDFDFNPQGSLASRSQALKALHVWWNKEGGQFRPFIPAPR